MILFDRHVREKGQCRLITTRIGLLYLPSIQNHNFDINNSVKFSESPSLFIPIDIWVMIKKILSTFFSCTALLNCAILSDVVWHDEDPSTIGLNSAANGPQWWCVFISKIFANRSLNTIQEPNVFVKFLKKKTCIENKMIFIRISLNLVFSNIITILSRDL